jgi:hypothetical protein
MQHHTGGVFNRLNPSCRNITSEIEGLLAACNFVFSMLQTEFLNQLCDVCPIQQKIVPEKCFMLCKDCSVLKLLHSTYFSWKTYRLNFLRNIPPQKGHIKCNTQNRGKIANNQLTAGQKYV